MRVVQCSLIDYGLNGYTGNQVVEQVFGRVDDLDWINVIAGIEKVIAVFKLMFKGVPEAGELGKFNFVEQA